MKPILQTRGLYLNFNNKQILNNTCIDIYGGEVHALVGNHDEGKTFLCRTLCGILKPTRGYIQDEKQQVCARRYLQDNVEVMWENSSLFERMTVAENIVIGTRYSWFNLFFKHKTVLGHVTDWLKENGVTLRANMIVEDLSPSDKTFICLLRCLYRQPKILILDSALSTLPAEALNRAHALIRNHLRPDTAVLWVTHDVESISEYADRVSILRRGNILLTEKTGAMERLNLLELCYAKLESNPSIENKQFRDMLLYFEALLEQLPLSIIILNTSNKITFANHLAKEIFNLDAIDFNQDISEIFAPAHANILQIITGPEGDDNLPISIPFKLNNQSSRMKIGVHSIHDKELIAGKMIILEDVTSTENMREKLNLADNLSSLGILAAGVSHEINNSLNILATYIAFLGGKASDEQREEAVTNIREEISEIKRITSNLRTFSGSNDSPSEVFNCTEVINNLVSILRFEARHNNIELRNETPDACVHVKASKGEIRQVLLNLVRNSFEAILTTGHPGRILLHETHNGDNSIITIEDNGPGIQHEKPTDIFLPFSSTKKGHYDNQGLGLSIAYGIIKRHKGSLTVKNLASGGCIFTIELPAANTGNSNSQQAQLNSKDT